MDISLDLILWIATSVAVGLAGGSAITFILYDRYATRIHNANMAEFEKAIGLYQKEIDILKQELDDSQK